MIPFIIIGFVGWLFGKSVSSKPSLKDSPTQVSGEVRVHDPTPHLSEFKKLISGGHRPSKWLVNGAIEEAYQLGNWSVVKAITDNYTESYPELSSSESDDKTENLSTPQEPAKIDSPTFSIHSVTSPIEGISNDDWRMFVDASRTAPETFDSENSVGMFRQNKKRLAKMGISDPKDPVAQYSAFEKEIEQLVEEGKNLAKLHVAMPIDIDGESVPITLSGLLSVMRNAGTKNAEKWLDSPEDRRKFPNTTDAFKRANGCF